MTWALALELFAVGLGVGSYGTLIGAGGGFLIVPILLLIYGIGSAQATATSLSVVFLNALSGSSSYARQKRIDYTTAVRFGIATLPGSILGAYAAVYIQSSLFRVVFGILLLLMGVWLFTKPSLEEGPGPVAHASKNHVHRHLVDAGGAHFRWRFDERSGMVLSLFIGFLSSFLGVGGGIIYVPLLVLVFSFPVHVAMATSLFILAISSATGALTHLFMGNILIEMAVPMGLGVILGAQTGAWLARRVQGTWLIRLHAIAISLVSIRLIMG